LCAVERAHVRIVLGDAVDPLLMVNLPRLMEHTGGRAEIVVGILDGPIAPGVIDGTFGEDVSVGGPGIGHGTFVAAMLAAERSSAAPAICPGCTIFHREIFDSGQSGAPIASPRDVAEAIVECVDAGAAVINLSSALMSCTQRERRSLQASLDHAMRRGVIVVAAAGNQGRVGGSVITAHPWVISVAGFGSDGRPLDLTNLGAAAGKRGLGAPAEKITSLAPDGSTVDASGTSFAVPFVTGTSALLFSAVPRATGPAVRAALTQSPRRRRSIVPPLLDAWSAYLWMREKNVRE
jgi:subtilisin family serine protease